MRGEDLNVILRPEWPGQLQLKIVGLEVLLERDDA